MKFLKIVLLFFIFCLRVEACEWKFIVIPTGYISEKTLNNERIDIEELFLEKFIKFYEKEKSYKIPNSVNLKKLLNSEFDQNKGENNQYNKIKFVLNTLNENQALIICITTAFRSDIGNKQPAFKNEFSQILNSDNNVKLITNVGLYNIISEKFIWSDIYYNNIEISDTKDIKSDVILSYYDNLIPKIFKSIQKDFEKKKENDKKQTKTIDFSKKLKSGYEKIKLKTQHKKSEKKSNDVIFLEHPNEDNTIEAVKNMQTRPRKSIEKKPLKFDTTVNEI